MNAPLRTQRLSRSVQPELLARARGMTSLATLAIIGMLAFTTAATAAERRDPQLSPAASKAATVTTAKAQSAKKTKARAARVASTTSVPAPAAAPAAALSDALPAVTATRSIATGASSGYGVAPMSAPTASIAAAVRTAPAEEERVAELASATDSAADNDATPANRPNPNRYVTRFRLDDGRYRGFHQNNPDELRSGDAVQTENDRIRAEHRARGRDLYP